MNISLQNLDHTNRGVIITSVWMSVQDMTLFIILPSSTVYAEKNDRSLTLNNWIPRKDRAMKLMAYERTWPNVQYDWISLSYHENSLSGLVFYKNKNIAHSQPVSPVLTSLLTGL
jgi:hypothetical protein